MLPADALLPEGATALEIPSDRPASVNHLKGPGSLAAATATRGLADPPPPDFVKVYHHHHGCSPDDDDTAVRIMQSVAYARITPSGAPCCANPEAFIRRVFRTLALDLPQNFQFLPLLPGCADIPLLFRRPGHRDAAVRRQPFQLDGVTVNLLPLQVVLNISRGYMVHVALHDYPIEQRTWMDTRENCCRFGFLREMDAACLGTPDLSTVRVVLELRQPREIPRELRLNYDDGSSSIVPVEIVRVWERSHSYDANGRYVPLFKHPPERPITCEDEARRALAIWLYSVASGH